MAMPRSDKIWFNGEMVDWDDAQIHVLTHAVHYGSSVFEGIRCYETNSGPAVFRLQDHINRLFDSAKIYRMEIGHAQEKICTAVLETIRLNNLRQCYIRPISFRGYGSLGGNPLDCPTDTVIAVWEWGQYLGPEALQKGVSVCTSSWNRMAPNTMPSLAKAGGNYLNSQLVKMEAKLNGYDEGVVLDADGVVSEGSGENLFVVKNGCIFTPSTRHSILPGITRHSVITLARELGLRVEQRPVPRESLYIADELFFTGTAAEITPIRAVDQISIGCGERGAITASLQESFFAVTSGEKEDSYGWLTPVQA